MPTKPRKVVLDSLRSQVPVIHRSSDDIQRREGEVKLVEVLDGMSRKSQDDKSWSIKLAFKDEAHTSHASKPDNVIDVRSVISLKSKDYQDHDGGGVFEIFHVLSIEHKHEREVRHAFLQFNSLQDRNMWYQGLKAVHEWQKSLGLDDTTAQVEDVPRDKKSKHATISNVTLEPPDPPAIVKLRFSLVSDDGREIDRFLEIKPEDASSEQCKKLCTAFMQLHNVLPTEGSSLYRLVRSIVIRVLMEQESEKISQEIKAQRFENILDGRNLWEFSEMVDMHKAKERSDARLRELSESLKVRLGQHGAGSEILEQIFRKSIEKLIVMNELALKVAVAETHSSALALSGNVSPTSSSLQSPRSPKARPKPTWIFTEDDSPGS